MLDIRRMRVLREVAARGSFSAAAAALAYTQSAVSQQIAALERETGTRLVERGARGVRLTDAGRALVAHTDAILARLDDAEAELDAIAGLRSGHLRLVAFPSVASSLMPPAIARFRDAHPAVELTLRPAEPEDGMALVKAGEADIALTIETADERAALVEGLDREVLLDDPMFLVLPRGHALAARRRLRLEDLAGEAWIMGSNTGTCPDARILLRACARAGFEPDVAFQSDDYLAIQGFIAAGVGVSLIPDLALVTVRDDVIVRSLGPAAPRRRIVAATLQGAWASPAKEAMLDVLRAVGTEFAQERTALRLAG
ncbi:MAG TPA: LysR substrate-binding domain-containing protein [Solirubrobacteraceae bacterium]|nr:LysR substrate-binding domain-containing protein [Solirubrobacteraceae bacterium]